MEQSILKSTKKLLNLPDDYTAFDLDVLTCINTAFSSLNQLGIGPDDGFSVSDEDAVWNDFGVPEVWLSMIKPYVYLKVRTIFDPPPTSFSIEAAERQIAEHEWRLSNFRELTIPIIPVEPALPPDVEVEYIPIETYIEGGY